VEGRRLEPALDLPEGEVEISPRERSSGALTSPSIRIRQASGLAAGSGIWPLLRMKNFEVGVVSSLRRCSGVSATKGCSPSTTSPGSLPGKRSGAGPEAAPALDPPCASAAGTRPDGIRAANGIEAPTAAPMAARLAPLRKPRRPKTTASARSGSSA